MENAESLKDIIFLISNVMEGYSVALFIADQERRDGGLRLFCYDSFSKNIDENCRLTPGEGLIGWVYREQKAIVVKNFDNDTSTLKIYTKNEEIKSFMAVPLPGKKGVLCVDSKKSYIFTEDKEKIFKQISIIVAKYINKLKSEEEKINLKNLLECSLKIDDCLFFSNGHHHMINNIFQIIFTYFNTKAIIMYFFGSKKYLFSMIDNVITISNNTNNSFDNDIIPICMKNRKTICRNKINTKVSLFVARYGNLPLTNYLCIPLFSLQKNDNGCLMLSKKGDLSWQKGEVQFLERIARKLFLILSNENAGRL